MDSLNMYLDLIYKRSLKYKDGIYRIDTISYYVENKTPVYLATKEGIYNSKGLLLVEYQLTGFSCHRETRKKLEAFLVNK